LVQELRLGVKVRTTVNDWAPWGRVQLNATVLVAFSVDALVIGTGLPSS
jgi:hypothetical protein